MEDSSPPKPSPGVHLVGSALEGGLLSPFQSAPSIYEVCAAALRRYAPVGTSRPLHSLLSRCCNENLLTELSRARRCLHAEALSEVPVRAINSRIVDAEIRHSLVASSPIVDAEIRHNVVALCRLLTPRFVPISLLRSTSAGRSKVGVAEAAVGAREHETPNQAPNVRADRAVYGPVNQSKLHRTRCSKQLSDYWFALCTHTSCKCCTVALATSSRLVARPAPPKR